MNTLKMKTTNAVLVMITGFMLAACGGGGGGSSDGAALDNTQVAGSTSGTETASTNEPAAEPIEVDEVASTSSAVNSTEDLVVTETFLFSSNYKVTVAANLNSDFDHLTVCYTRDGTDQADYDNCLLRADLNSGVFNGELLVTNDTDYLVVSAWDYADAENPSVSYWNDGDLISIN